MGILDRIKETVRRAIVTVKSYYNLTVGTVLVGIRYAQLKFRERYLVNISKLTDKSMKIKVKTVTSDYSYVVPKDEDKVGGMMGKKVYGIKNGEIIQDCTQEPGTPYPFNASELGFDSFRIYDEILDSSVEVSTVPYYLE